MRRTRCEPAQRGAAARFRVVVPALPRISNHTDFDALRAHPDVDLQFVRQGEAIAAGRPDHPARAARTRAATWHGCARRAGRHASHRHLRYGGKVIGICGGIQMLGREVADPHGVEGAAGRRRAWACSTYTTADAREDAQERDRPPRVARPPEVGGYEIHMGEHEDRRAGIAGAAPGRWAKCVPTVQFPRMARSRDIRARAVRHTGCVRRAAGLGGTERRRTESTTPRCAKRRLTGSPICWLKHLDLKLDGCGGLTAGPPRRRDRVPAKRLSRWSSIVPRSLRLSRGFCQYSTICVQRNRAIVLPSGPVTVASQDLRAAAKVHALRDRADRRRRSPCREVAFSSTVVNHRAVSGRWARHHSRKRCPARPITVAA